MSEQAAEKTYSSVKEAFKERAPDLISRLDEKDPFWEQVNDNSISNEDLDSHLRLLEEMGQTPESSDVMKAIYLIQDLRQTSLPTPIRVGFSRSKKR